MTGLMDMYAAQAGPVSQPAVGIPSTPGERFSAEVESSTAPDRWFNLTGARRDWHQKVVDELHTETGQKYLNPYDPVTPEEMMRLGNQPAVEDERRNKIIEANRALRETKPDAINAEGIDTFIGVEGDAARRKAAELVGTGNGLSAFAGGMFAPTPENAIGLLIPPSRAVFGVVNVGRSFLYGVGREALFQGAAMGGLTAASEGLDVLSRRETGTAPTGGEVASDILEGAAGGALFGGAFHALHLGSKALWERWTKLPETVRANAPLEVKDAFNLIGTDAIYSSSNRLGLPPLLHERYQGRANDAVMRGMPVDFSDLARAGDTPLTALSTIMRSVPPEGGIRPQITGLGNVLDRVRSLPDTEIEAVARELKPTTFAPLDAVDAKLKALDERISALKQEAEQIGIPDIIDLDTAALIKDAEEGLKKPALTRQQRIDLEHQRDTWLQSVDPRGEVARELERVRKEFFPEHDKKMEEIQAEVKSLMNERNAARSVVDREVEALRKRLGSLVAGNQFGDNAMRDVLEREFAHTPESLDAATQRADFNRQATIAQETGFFGARSAEATGATGARPPGKPPASGPKTNPLGRDGELPKEQMAAMSKQTADMLLNPEVAAREVNVDGMTMTAARAMEETDRMAKDAATAASCVAGVPL